MLHKSKITVKVSFIHSPLIDLIESLSQKGDLPSTTDAETKLPAHTRQGLAFIMACRADIEPFP